MFRGVDHRVSWTLIPFFKFYENKLVPMKAKPDPKATLCSWYTECWEEVFRFVSNSVVNHSSASQSQTERRESDLYPKNKTGSHLTGKKKVGGGGGKDKVLFKNNSFHTVSHGAQRNKFKAGNSSRILIQLLNENRKTQLKITWRSNSEVWMMSRSSCCLLG